MGVGSSCRHEGDSEALSEDGLHDDSNLLRQGARLIRARNHCYGCLQYPVCCTHEAAWDVFRSAIADPGYYLSLQVAIANASQCAYDAD